MYLQALIAVYLFGKFAGKIFFGTLRAAESEVTICNFTIAINFVLYFSYYSSST